MRARDAAKAEAKAEAMVRTALKGRHGPLYRWFDERFDDLEADRAGRGSDWVGAARALNRLGLRKKSGEPLDAKTCRLTYGRVLENRKKTGKVRRGVGGAAISFRGVKL